MGLYDFLLEHKISFDKLIDMVYDLSKFVYVGNVENLVRDLDDLYDAKEFRKLKKQLNQGGRN